MTISIDRYYAAQADAAQRKEDRLGRVYGDPSITGLRCFQRYHKEATRDIVDPWGRTRWLSQKQSRIYAILDRDSSNGTRVLKMKDIASEAMASISTVSRTVVKLQAFGLFAIDVIRGRRGGISVRKRHIGDHLKYYADAAWKRIRAWINVASAKTGKGEVSRDSLLTEVATFSRERRVEYAGARILDGSWSIDYARAVVGPARGRPTEADLVDERATAWALEVIAERARLDREDPDWDYADLR